MDHDHPPSPRRPRGDATRPLSLLLPHSAEADESITKEQPVQVLFWRGARMSKKSKTRRRSRTPSETHALRPGPNWPLLAVSSLGIALTGYLSWTAFSGGAVQGCSAGGGCDIVLTSRWATLLGLPTALWGLLGYTALAAHRVRPPSRHALVLCLDRRILRRLLQRLPDGGVPDDSRVRVSVLPDVARTHDGHARARGVATSSRDGAPLLGGFGRWSGRARGRGDPAPPRQLHRSASRAHRAGRPDDPCAGGAPDRGRRLVLRRIVVSALSGTEATLRGVRKPSPVHRMQPRWTQCPAGTVMHTGPACRPIQPGSSMAGLSSGRC